MKTKTDISHENIDGQVIGLKRISTGELIPIKRKVRSNLGSSPEADIFISNPHVSKTHCLFHWEDDLLVVVDKSKNGTLINGHKIHFSTLSPGDLLQVGRVHLLVFSEKNKDTNKIGKSLIDHTKQLVEINGSNKKAAEVLGVSPSTVGRWVKNKRISKE